jgi:Ca2+-binding EF-hand superfamily protein
LRRADFFIQELDANHNGVIEAEEVEGRRRFFADRILQQAGLEPNYPIAVAKVREGIQRYYQPYIAGTAPGMTPGATMPGAMPQLPMPGGMGLFPGGPPFGGPAQGQFSPADFERRRQFEQMYAEARHLDEEGNRNGVIEAEEATGGRSHSHKEIFERVMAKAGLPATTPVKLELVRERLAAAHGLTPSGAPLPAGQGGTTPSSGAVRGFGEPQPARPPVPGFGPVAPTSTVSTTTQGSSAASGSGTTGGGSGSSGGSEDERIRGYAKSLLSQYDRNKDGVLEPGEYREMRGDVRSADRNGDGKVDQEELIVWLKRFSQGGSSSSGGSSGRSSSSSSASAKPGKLRLSTALERLPSGLPDWFFEKDANTDGQVSMAEFTSSWTEAKLAEFMRYDLNGDGIITPAECLAVEKQKSVAAKDSKPPERPPDKPPEGPPERR